MRIVRAFANILEAPRGLLFAPDDAGRFTVTGAWHWDDHLPDAAVAGQGLDAMWPLLGAGRVIEFDAQRHRWGSSADLSLPVPDWLLAEERLVGRRPAGPRRPAVGLVLLAAPDFADRSTGKISTCSAPPVARPPQPWPRRPASSAQ